ncbi:MAG: ABC-F family ATP-binding cassette domain-containing protein [Anaerolineales bacterium]
MLTAHHLSKTYGITPILQEISFSIRRDERVGLIGPNGCGKTTLLRILTGDESPDSGTVTYMPAALRIGYLPQGFAPPPNTTLADLLQRQARRAAALDAEVAALAAQLTHSPNDAALQRTYDAVLAELQALPAENPAEVQAILSAFGLAHVPQNQPVDLLSGGQKTRLALALLLLEHPQILLLDEPTNHLDSAMLHWLEDWLTSFAGAALVVSHDRAFLDATVHRILDLDPESHTITAYEGNYTDYVEQYRAARARHWETYRDQQAEIRRVRQDIQRTKQQALHVELTTTSRQPNVRRYAKKVARKAASREKKLERYLDSDERVEKPQSAWQIKLEFAAPHLGQQVIQAENLSIGYAGFPALAHNLNLTLHSNQRVALTGENGCGKTTLLRTLAGTLPPLAGSVQRGASVKLGYMTQEQDNLNPLQNALLHVQQVAALNETEARNFLHYFLFSGDDALRPANLLSYGERARLALALLVAQGCNLLLLDEPINHLDIPSSERFEQTLLNFQGTILAVVHDRYFVQRFATHVWQLSAENGLLQVG